MAEETERDQRTEPASGQRKERAWEEGQIPLGRDATIVLGLLAACGTLAALGGILRASLSEMIGFTARSLDRMPFRDLGPIAAKPAGVAFMVLAAAGLASAACTLAQTGGRTWGQRLAPDFSRVFGAPQFKRLFSKDLFIDLLLNFAKVATLGAVAWRAAKASAPNLTVLLGASLDDQLRAIAQTVLNVGRPTLAMAVVLAVAEWLISRFRWEDRLKMTKEEVKRESREEDGDPLLKGKRKKKHRQFSRSRARREVPRADALLVNPTHIAIALRYRRTESKAPRVTAKGKGVLAEYMRELARENTIPIVEDIPLARFLYRKVGEGQEIPAQTYKAVAAILAFVYRVTGRRPGTGATL